ncbi:protein of unknown function (plasmid) [Cupriavidus taiwanensis]|uniref:Uncharacterized protein n=1 Tax=Cupriavidus taiwanensis TaxID=164546 RepID=A0A9Q7UXW5_9BURK|nr:protein of unknown function [Cupriavidus taiwanensis]
MESHRGPAPVPAAVLRGPRAGRRPAGPAARRCARARQRLRRPHGRPRRSRCPRQRRAGTADRRSGRAGIRLGPARNHARRWLDHVQRLRHQGRPQLEGPRRGNHHHRIHRRPAAEGAGQVPRLWVLRRGLRRLRAPADQQPALRGRGQRGQRRGRGAWFAKGGVCHGSGVRAQAGEDHEEGGGLGSKLCLKPPAASLPRRFKFPLVYSLSRLRERGESRRTASGSAFRFIPSLKSHPPTADNVHIPPRRPSPRQSHQSRTRAPCLSSVLASPA